MRDRFERLPWLLLGAILILALSRASQLQLLQVSDADEEGWDRWQTTRRFWSVVALPTLAGTEAALLALLARGLRRRSPQLEEDSSTAWGDATAWLVGIVAPLSLWAAFGSEGFPGADFPMAVYHTYDVMEAADFAGALLLFTVAVGLVASWPRRVPALRAWLLLGAGASLLLATVRVGKAVVPTLLLGGPLTLLERLALLGYPLWYGLLTQGMIAAACVWTWCSVRGDRPLERPAPGARPVTGHATWLRIWGLGTAATALAVVVLTLVECRWLFQEDTDASVWSLLGPFAVAGPAVVAGLAALLALRWTESAAVHPRTAVTCGSVAMTPVVLLCALHLLDRSAYGVSHVAAALELVAPALMLALLGWRVRGQDALPRAPAPVD